MKVAIYNRGKKLAVREQPGADAPMVGTLDSGTAVVVEDAGTGWLECCMGYIRADLVAVGELYGGIGTAEETPADDWGREQPEHPQEEPKQEAPEEEAQPQEALAEDAQPQEEQPEQRAEEATAEEAHTEDENAALKAMKLNDLRELAKGSGIALPKNATKAQIIELLMRSDEQA